MTTYDEVNKALQAILEYLKSIENVWNKSRNLKLYDVFFHGEEIIDKYPLVKEEYDGNDLFYDFCQLEYDYFVEWMEENKIKDERKYIGHTSTFYLTDHHDENLISLLEYLVNENIYYTDIRIAENGNMLPFVDMECASEEEQIQDAQDEMSFIADGRLLEEIKKHFADAVQIAEYIDGFMKNQIDAFTEYIAFKEEYLQEEREQEEEQERAFIEKYAAAIADIAAAIDRIINDTGCSTSDIRHMVNNAILTITA